MGSVTIHLLVEKSLSTGVPLTKDDDFNFDSTSHILPADSSLAELMDLVQVKSLCNNVDKLEKLTTLDLSYNPVKNISSIVRMNTERSGPRSKTLQSLNWYPSGKLCILPTASNSDSKEEDEEMLQRFLKWQSRNVVHEEDFAYNDPTIQKQQHSTVNKKEEGVQWTGVGAENHQSLKPSEIFSAVSSRADNDGIHQDGQQGHKKPPTKKKRSEQQRTQRLDTIIQNLEARASKDGKKKRVSEKVRTMLIKSRAEGNKKLRMEDRFHLEVLCLIDSGDASTATPSDETTSASSYKFFSRVTTAGRVASSVSGPVGKSMSVELLVSVNNNYRRLPNTMSLHDAQQSGWLQEFDTVIVRTFSLERDDGFCQSRSVLDPESDDDDGENDEMDDMQVELKSAEEEAVASPSNGDGVRHPEVDDQANHFQQRLHMIYNTSSFETSAKKKKPASKQVHRMLMKSKSRGDKGIKPDDRVHLDTIIFRDDGSEDINVTCSSSFRFFSKRTSIEHLVSIFQEENAANVEILVPQPCESCSLGCVYQQISPANLTLEEALEREFLEDFGRLIVRVTFD